VFFEQPLERRAERQPRVERAAGACPQGSRPQSWDLPRAATEADAGVLDPQRPRARRGDAHEDLVVAVEELDQDRIRLAARRPQFADLAARGIEEPEAPGAGDQIAQPVARAQAVLEFGDLAGRGDPADPRRQVVVVVRRAGEEPDVAVRPADQVLRHLIGLEALAEFGDRAGRVEAADRHAAIGAPGRPRRSSPFDPEPDVAAVDRQRADFRHGRRQAIAEEAARPVRGEPPDPRSDAFPRRVEEDAAAGAERGREGRRIRGPPGVELGDPAARRDPADLPRLVVDEPEAAIGARAQAGHPTVGSEAGPEGAEPPARPHQPE